MIFSTYNKHLIFQNYPYRPKLVISEPKLTDKVEEGTRDTSRKSDEQVV